MYIGNQTLKNIAWFRGFVALCLALVAVLTLIPRHASGAPVSECENFQANHPDWVFCQDFENGTTVPIVGDPWPWPVTTTAPFDGGFAMDMQYDATPRPSDNGGTGFAVQSLVKLAGSRLNEFRIRFYEKLSANWVWSPVATKGWMLGRGDGGDVELYVTHDFWGAATRIAQVCDSPAGACTNLPDNLSPGEQEFLWSGSNLGRWVLVEVHIKLNDFGTANGVFEQWIDGRQTHRYTNIEYRNTNPGVDGVNDVMISGYWNCLNTDCLTAGNAHPTMHRYFDNIVISRGNTPIGPWIPGSSVDKIPPGQPQGLRVTGQ